MSKKTAKNTSAKPAAKSAPAAPAKKSAIVTELVKELLKPAAPAEKPLVDLSKLSTKNLRIALNQETAMKPAVALAYREELAKREAAKPALEQALREAAKPASAPADPKLAAPAAPAALKLHLNNTGRLCFTKGAADRLKAAGVSEESVKAEKAHIAYSIQDGLIRFEFASAPAENTLKVRMGAGRPYVSATKQFKPLGFAPASGSNGLDIEAKPYGAAGFEFRLPL